MQVVERVRVVEQQLGHGGTLLEERVNTVGQALDGLRTDIAAIQAFMTTTGTKQELMGIFESGKEDLRKVMEKQVTDSQDANKALGIVVEDMKDWTKKADTRMQMIEDKLTLDIGQLTQGTRDLSLKIEEL